LSVLGHLAGRHGLGLAVWALGVTLFVSPLPAEKARKSAPDLTRVHHIASSKATFRTPDDWVITGVGESPEVVTAEGGELVVRFLRWNSEAGLDSIHVTCMVERAGVPEAIEASVRYEYEFQSGERNEWRVLDSAFSIQYESPVKGFRDWRQRVVTLVGKGEALCVVAFCPVPSWKKSSASREMIEAVVSSVSLP
jgi:hypothetical protein